MILIPVLIPFDSPLFAFRGSVSVPAASDTSLPPPQEPKHIGGAFRMERFDVWKGGFREILGPRKFSGKLWYKCQPWMTPNGCLIGRVPFKYQILTIGGIPPLINTLWITMVYLSGVDIKLHVYPWG